MGLRGHGSELHEGAFVTSRGLLALTPGSQRVHSLLSFAFSSLLPFMFLHSLVLIRWLLVRAFIKDGYMETDAASSTGDASLT